MQKFFNLYSKDIELIISKRFDYKKKLEFIDSLKGSDFIINCSGAIPQRINNLRNKNHKENYYKITIAVAGFSIENLSVEVSGTLLVVKARSPLKAPETEYLHRGIAQRPFIKNFRLENNVKVYNAELIEGMLSIYLEKIIPKDTSPIKIKINTKNT